MDPVIAETWTLHETDVACPDCGAEVEAEISARAPHLRLVGGPATVRLVVGRITCPGCGRRFDT